MKTIIRQCTVFAVSMSLSHLAICDDSGSNVVLAVSAKLSECVALLPAGKRGLPEYMREFGLADRMIVPETELGQLVSNQVDVVYSNFSAIASSSLGKMLFLASAWRLGDDYYLNCLSRNVDLAIDGTISADELRWYLKGHRTRRLTYILAAQYDRPGVSNIVHRLIAYTGETNKYEKVLSGEAKAEYLELEQFMADGPESPCQPE